MAKIKNARSTGLLVTRNQLLMTYHTGNTPMRWNVRSELRAKVVLKRYLTKIRSMNQYQNTEIGAILFGDKMEIAYELLRNENKNYFMLDETFSGFYYFPAD